MQLYFVSFILCILSVATNATPAPTFYPTAKGNIKCVEYQSCRDEELHANEVHCTGYSSCMESQISAQKLFMYGKHSRDVVLHQVDVGYFYGVVLSDVAIRLPKKSFIYGDSVLASANLHTEAVEHVYAEFFGFNGVSDSRITCSSGSTCKFVCGDCRNSYFVAEPNARIEIECLYKDFSCLDVLLQYAGESLCITGDGSGSVEISSTERRLRAGNLNLSTSSKTRKLQEDDEVKACYEPLECSKEQFVLGDTDTSPTRIECFGVEACKDTHVDGISDISSAVDCDGHESCFQIQAEHIGYTYCDGYLGCKNAYVEGTVFRIDGYQTGESMVAKSFVHDGEEDPEIELTARGLDSFHNSLFICDTKRKCLMDCSGINACKGAIYDCSSADTDSCDFVCKDHAACSAKDKFLYIEPCSNIPLDKCDKNAYCANFDGVCVSRRTLCENFETSASCKTMKKFCQWKRGSCTLKSSKMPRVYKRFDRI